MFARAYFVLCLAAGRLLRSARYSTARIDDQDGKPLVRKHRLFYAPLLVWMGGPLVRLLNTGVRVLPQREWEERERQIYTELYGTSIRIEADGTLVLPRLAGETLAAVLEDPGREESIRKRAIELAVIALAKFHRLGFTHGDAMAENVLVDLEAGVAHWFDFETIHDSSRPMAWRRADDVRALLVTCLVRTVPEKHAETLAFILDVYADEEVTRVLAASFASVWRRPLTFHLAQAGVVVRVFPGDRPDAALGRGQVSQLVRIPHDVNCFHHIAFNLEGVGLQQPVRPAHDQSRKTVDRVEADRHIVSPSLADNAGHLRERIIEHVVQQKCRALERRQPVQRQQQRH